MTRVCLLLCALAAVGVGGAPTVEHAVYRIESVVRPDMRFRMFTIELKFNESLAVGGTLSGSTVSGATPVTDLSLEKACNDFPEGSINLQGVMTLTCPTTSMGEYTFGTIPVDDGMGGGGDPCSHGGCGGDPGGVTGGGDPGGDPGGGVPPPTGGNNGPGEMPSVAGALEFWRSDFFFDYPSLSQLEAMPGVLPHTQYPPDAWPEGAPQWFTDATADQFAPIVPPDAAGDGSFPDWGDDPSNGTLTAVGSWPPKPLNWDEDWSSELGSWPPSSSKRGDVEQVAGPGVGWTPVAMNVIIGPPGEGMPSDLYDEGFLAANETWDYEDAGLVPGVTPVRPILRAEFLGKNPSALDVGMNSFIPVSEIGTGYMLGVAGVEGGIDATWELGLYSAVSLATDMHDLTGFSSWVQAGEDPRDGWWSDHGIEMGSEGDAFDVAYELTQNFTDTFMEQMVGWVPGDKAPEDYLSVVTGGFANLHGLHWDDFDDYVADMSPGHPRWADSGLYNPGDEAEFAHVLAGTINFMGEGWATFDFAHCIPHWVPTWPPKFSTSHRVPDIDDEYFAFPVLIEVSCFLETYITARSAYGLPEEVLPAFSLGVGTKRETYDPAVHTLDPPTGFNPGMDLGSFIADFISDDLKEGAHGGGDDPPQRRLSFATQQTVQREVKAGGFPAARKLQQKARPAARRLNSCGPAGCADDSTAASQRSYKDSCFDSGAPIMYAMAPLTTESPMATLFGVMGDLDRTWESILPDIVSLGIILEFWEEEQGIMGGLIDESRLGECTVRFNPSGSLGVNPITQQRNYLSSLASGVPVSSALAVNVSAAPVVCNHTAYAASQARLLDLLEQPLSSPSRDNDPDDRFHFDDYEAIDRIAWQVTAINTERGMSECRTKFENMLTSASQEVSRDTKRCGKPRLVEASSNSTGDGDDDGPHTRRLALRQLQRVAVHAPKGVRKAPSRFAASVRAQLSGQATHLASDTHVHAGDKPHGAAEWLHRGAAEKFAKEHLQPLAAALSGGGGEGHGRRLQSADGGGYGGGGGDMTVNEEWLSDPCCNWEAQFESCCTVRPVTFERTAVTGVDEALVGEQCHAVSLQTALDTLTLLGEDMNRAGSGDASTDRCARFASSGRDAIEDRMEWYRDCVEELHEEKDCTRNADCPSEQCDDGRGKCQIPWQNPPLMAEIFAECLLDPVTADPQVLTRVKADLGLPASASHAAFAAAVAEASLGDEDCVGHSAWNTPGATGTWVWEQDLTDCDPTVAYCPWTNTYVPGNETLCLQDKSCNWDRWSWDMNEERCLRGPRGAGGADMCMECWGDPGEGNCWSVTQPSQCSKNDYWGDQNTMETACEADGLDWVFEWGWGRCENITATDRASCMDGCPFPDDAQMSWAEEQRTNSWNRCTGTYCYNRAIVDQEACDRTSQNSGCTFTVNATAGEECPPWDDGWQQQQLWLDDSGEPHEWVPSEISVCSMSEWEWESRFPGVSIAGGCVPGGPPGWAPPSTDIDGCAFAAGFGSNSPWWVDTNGASCPVGAGYVEVPEELWDVQGPPPAAGSVFCVLDPDAVDAGGVLADLPDAGSCSNGFTYLACLDSTSANCDNNVPGWALTDSQNCISASVEQASCGVKIEMSVIRFPVAGVPRPESNDDGPGAGGDDPAPSPSPSPSPVPVYWGCAFSAPFGGEGSTAQGADSSCPTDAGYYDVTDITGAPYASDTERFCAVEGGGAASFGASEANCSDTGVGSVTTYVGCFAADDWGCDNQTPGWALSDAGLCVSSTVSWDDCSGEALVRMEATVQMYPLYADPRPSVCVFVAEFGNYGSRYTGEGGGCPSAGYIDMGPPPGWNASATGDTQLGTGAEGLLGDYVWCAARWGAVGAHALDCPVHNSYEGDDFDVDDDWDRANYEMYVGCSSSAKQVDGVDACDVFSAATTFPNNTWARMGPDAPCVSSAFTHEECRALDADPDTPFYTSSMRERPYYAYLVTPHVATPGTITRCAFSTMFGDNYNDDTNDVPVCPSPGYREVPAPEGSNAPGHHPWCVSVTDVIGAKEGGCPTWNAWDEGGAGELYYGCRADSFSDCAELRAAIPWGMWSNYYEDSEWECIASNITHAQCEEWDNAHDDDDDSGGYPVRTRVNDPEGAYWWTGTELPPAPAPAPAPAEASASCVFVAAFGGEGSFYANHDNGCPSAGYVEVGPPAGWNASATGDTAYANEGGYTWCAARWGGVASHDYECPIDNDFAGQATDVDDDWENAGRGMYVGCQSEGDWDGVTLCDAFTGSASWPESTWGATAAGVCMSSAYSAAECDALSEMYSGVHTLIQVPPYAYLRQAEDNPGDIHRCAFVSTFGDEDGDVPVCPYPGYAEVAAPGGNPHADEVWCVALSDAVGGSHGDCPTFNTWDDANDDNLDMYIGCRTYYDTDCWALQEAMPWALWSVYIDDGVLECTGANVTFEQCEEWDAAIDSADNTPWAPGRTPNVRSRVKSIQQAYWLTASELPAANMSSDPRYAASGCAFEGPFGAGGSSLVADGARCPFEAGYLTVRDEDVAAAGRDPATRFCVFEDRGFGSELTYAVSANECQAAVNEHRECGIPAYVACDNPSTSLCDYTGIDFDGWTLWPWWLTRGDACISGIRNLDACQSSETSEPVLADVDAFPLGATGDQPHAQCVPEGGFAQSGCAFSVPFGAGGSRNISDGAQCPSAGYITVDPLDVAANGFDPGVRFCVINETSALPVATGPAECTWSSPFGNMYIGCRDIRGSPCGDLDDNNNPLDIAEADITDFDTTAEDNVACMSGWVEYGDCSGNAIEYRPWVTEVEVFALYPSPSPSPSPSSAPSATPTISVTPSPSPSTIIPEYITCAFTSPVTVAGEGSCEYAGGTPLNGLLAVPDDPDAVNPGGWKWCGMTPDNPNWLDEAECLAARAAGYNSEFTTCRVWGNQLQGYGGEAITNPLLNYTRWSLTYDLEAADVGAAAVRSDLDYDTCFGMAGTSPMQWAVGSWYAVYNTQPGVPVFPSASNTPTSSNTPSNTPSTSLSGTSSVTPTPSTSLSPSPSSYPATYFACAFTTDFDGCPNGAGYYRADAAVPDGSGWPTDANTTWCYSLSAHVDAASSANCRAADGGTFYQGCQDTSEATCINGDAGWAYTDDGKCITDMISAASCTGGNVAAITGAMRTYILAEDPANGYGACLFKPWAFTMTATGDMYCPDGTTQYVANGGVPPYLTEHGLTDRGDVWCYAYGFDHAQFADEHECADAGSASSLYYGCADLGCNADNYASEYPGHDHEWYAPPTGTDLNYCTNFAITSEQCAAVPGSSLGNADGKWAPVRADDVPAAPASQSSSNTPSNTPSVTPTISTTASAAQTPTASTSLTPSPTPSVTPTPQIIDICGVDAILDSTSNAAYCADPATLMFIDGAGGAHCQSTSHAPDSCFGNPMDHVVCYIFPSGAITDRDSCITEMGGFADAYYLFFAGSTDVCIAPGMDETTCDGLGGTMTGEGLIGSHDRVNNVIPAPFAGCSYDAEAAFGSGLATCGVDDVGAAAPTIGSAGRYWQMYSGAQTFCARPAADVDKAACQQLQADEVAGNLASNDDAYVGCAITCSSLQGYEGGAVTNAALDIASWQLLDGAPVDGAAVCHAGISAAACDALSGDGATRVVGTKWSLMEGVVTGAAASASRTPSVTPSNTASITPTASVSPSSPPVRRLMADGAPPRMSQASELRRRLEATHHPQPRGSTPPEPSALSAALGTIRDGFNALKALFSGSDVDVEMDLKFTGPPAVVRLVGEELHAALAADFAARPGRVHGPGTGTDKTWSHADEVAARVARLQSTHTAKQVDSHSRAVARRLQSGGTTPTYFGSDAAFNVQHWWHSKFTSQPNPEYNATFAASFEREIERTDEWGNTWTEWRWDVRAEEFVWLQDDAASGACVTNAHQQTVWANNQGGGQPRPGQFRTECEALSDNHAYWTGTWYVV